MVNYKPLYSVFAFQETPIKLITYLKCVIAYDIHVSVSSLMYEQGSRDRFSDKGSETVKI